MPAPHPLRCTCCLLVALSFIACTPSPPPAPAPAPVPTPAPAAQPSAADAQEAELARFNEIAHEIGRKTTEARNKGNRLSELLALEALQTQYTAEPDAQNVIHTLMGYALAPLGDYAEALRHFDLSSGPPPREAAPAPSLEGYAPVDALQLITGAADTAQVIMVNEAHAVPQTRAFVLQLLPVLRGKGFTHFASEMLHDSDMRLVERGYMPDSVESYGEPLHADLFRTALRLGYRVVPYEAKNARNSADREREQAANIVERILKNDPRAKILVNAGYDHIYESPLPNFPKTMAVHFKEMTGIDPFTVDQTMTEHSAPAYEPVPYRWATERGLISRPTALRNAAGQLWSYWQGVDVTVFHPRSVYEAGRPTWLRMDGLRSPFPLSDGICGPAPLCLVKARPVAEGTDAIPIDQIVVTAGKPVPALLLPDGDFVVRVEDAEGKLIEERNIHRARNRPEGGWR